MTPEMDIVNIETIDIITTSGETVLPEDSFWEDDWLEVYVYEKM